MLNKVAVVMSLPEGKLPGFYAQLIKALAGQAQLFDREKEMLIVDGDAEAEVVEGVLHRYQTETERLPLLLADTPEIKLYPDASDYGFTSRAEHVYFYADQIAVFELAAEGPASEPQPAFQQMEEHLLAVLHEEGAIRYVAPRPLLELMAGLAKAYGCLIRPL